MAKRTHERLTCAECGTIGAWKKSGYTRTEWMVRSGWSMRSGVIRCACCTEKANARARFLKEWWAGSVSAGPINGKTTRVTV